MKTRLKDKIVRLAALALALGGATSASADWLYWDAGAGSDTSFTTPANWSTDTFPGTSNTSAFEGDSIGKSVTFSEAGTAVADVYIRNNWWDAAALSPVVFKSSDGSSANGFTASGVFSCADIGSCRSSFEIQSGAYTAASGLWCWWENTELTAAISGGSLTFTTGPLQIVWANNTKGTASIDVDGGTLAVNAGGIHILSGCTSESSVEIDISNGGVVSCGTSETEADFRMGAWDSANGSVDVNLNANGTLKIWRAWNNAASTVTSTMTFNGGTLQALGATSETGGLVGSGITVTVGANGGTIDTAGNAVTIASAITGTGTLRIMGGGSVTFSVDPTCPILAVAGTTVLNSSGERIGYNTWQGADNGSWNNASNWSLGVVPTAEQIVKIDSDHTIKISGWDETGDNIADKVGALIVNGNVTFANGWSRLLVYGASGETAISGNGTLTLTTNTGLENFSSTGIQEISCGLTFGTNSDHAWLGGRTYGWRVTGTTTLNCKIQTDQNAEFAGPFVSNGGTINTTGHSSTFTCSSITGTGLEFYTAGGSASFTTAPSCPLTVYNGVVLSGALGDATFAAGSAFALASSTVTATSITCSGDLSISGTGTVNVSGNVAVTGTLSLNLDGSIVAAGTISASEFIVDKGGIDGDVSGSIKTRFRATSCKNSVSSGFQTKLTTDSAVTVDLTANPAAAVLAGDGDVTFDVGTGKQRYFSGSVFGNKSLTKSGEGELIYFANSAYTGSLNILGGTLKIGSPLIMSDIACDYDADVASSVSITESSATWTDMVSGTRTLTSAVATYSGDKEMYPDSTMPEYVEDGSLFGGKKVLHSTAFKMNESEAVAPKSLFMVVRTTGASDYSDLAGDTYGAAIYSGEYEPYYAFTRRSSSTGFLRVQSTGGNRKNHWSAANLWHDGDYAIQNSAGGNGGLKVEANKAKLYTVIGTDTWYKQGAMFYGDYREYYEMSWAEIIKFSRELSFDEKNAVEQYLMNKWSVGSATFAVVPATAAVALANNAVLDLGGTSQTVASLSGSGTVQNGTITVTTPISAANGVIKVPVGSTCDAADDGTMKITGTEYITFANGAASVGDTFYDAVQDAVDDLIDGTVSGTLTIYIDGASINLGAAEATIDVVLASGVSAPTVTANLPWVANYDPQTGAIVSERQAQTYVWTPGNSDTNWDTLSNWRIGTATPAAVPGSNDTVEFPSSGVPWSVALASDQVVNKVIFNGNTLLSGALIGCKEATGGSDIAVTLGDSAGFKDAGSNLTIAFKLEISASESAPARLYCSDASSNTRKIMLDTKSSISGNGYLVFNTEIDHVGNPAFEIKADMGNFYGYITLNKANKSSNRDNTKVWASTSGDNSHWILSNSLRNNGGNVSFFAEDKTYTYGQITGKVSHNGTGNFRLQIGKLGLADNVGGTFFNNINYTYSIQNYGGTIEKIGNGTATFYGSYVHAFEISSGELLITANGALQTFWNSNGRASDTLVVEDNEHYPTITFTGNSTLALGDAVTVDPTVNNQIVVNSGVAFGIATDTARIFANSIGYAGASFTKKGTGALTLSGQSVALVISVEDGSVTVPATSGCTAAKGTRREVSGDNYVFTKGPDIASGATVNNVEAADQTAADAIAATYNVMPAEGVDASCYKVVATETSAGSGVYTLSVKFADEVLEVASETVSGSTVTFTMANFKKGLYYGVVAGDSPELSEKGVSLKQSTDDQGTGVTTLSADMPGSGDAAAVKYYKIVVSDTATVE